MRNQISPTHFSSACDRPSKKVCEDMTHESQSQMSYSQSQPLFDSGINSSGRLTNWSQSSNSQPSSQPLPSRLSRSALLAHNNAGVQSKPSSDNGRSTISQGRMTMKDFFSVKKQRPGAHDYGDRPTSESQSAAVDLMKQCATQVHEAIGSCKSIIEEHSQTQKELLSTQSNSVFEELSNHCKIVATELKLRDEVHLEISDLKQRIETQQRELLVGKERLNDSLRRESEVQDLAKETHMGELATLTATLAKSISKNEQYCNKIVHAASTFTDLVDTLGGTAENLSSCLSTIKPLFSSLQDVVAKIEHQQTTVVSTNEAEVATKPDIKSRITKPATNTLPHSVNDHHQQEEESQEITSSGDGSLMLLFDHEHKDLVPKQRPRAHQFSKSLSESSTPATRHIRTPRTLVTTLPTAHNSTADIFDWAICSSTCSESEDDNIERGCQIASKRVPLEFVTSAKTPHSTNAPLRNDKQNQRSRGCVQENKKVPPTSDRNKGAMCRDPPRTVPGHVASKQPQPSNVQRPVKVDSKVIHNSKPKSRALHRPTDKPAVQRFPSPVVDEFEFSSDPAAEMFDELFQQKTKPQKRKAANQLVANSVSITKKEASRRTARQKRR